MRKLLITLSGFVLAVTAAFAATAPTSTEVMTHYADIAHATYGDALSSAKQLQGAIDTLVAEPTEDNLAAARNAWVAARHPYQQTEAYRFGNAIVDGWEGKVNSWPLDEGLIDYVDGDVEASDENPHGTANVIANPQLVLSGRTIDATQITKPLLAEELHEVDEIEANVATGYHAIEFLLWGQDLNGTGPGAGSRPATDYDPALCTGGNCERRAAYLTTATELLIDDLAWMVDQWAPGGDARAAVISGDTDKNLSIILTGMGSLSYGELAGERMKLGLMLHDPEEEQDCFSDNTHWSHYDDALGMRNVYTGTYKRVDGSTLEGPSLSELVAAKDAAVDTRLREALDATQARMQVLVDTAEGGEAYDQMIGAGNTEGNAKVQAAIDALLAQTKAIEGAVETLGLAQITFEGSESLDPAATNE